MFDVNQLGPLINFDNTQFKIGNVRLYVYLCEIVSEKAGIAGQKISFFKYLFFYTNNEMGNSTLGYV